ncbi:MAG TPA: hypothetical protein DHU81_14530, partial [Hyphomonas sp.]|nr:hypothetical protein [Hyphomonas sp.]
MEVGGQWPRSAAAGIRFFPDVGSLDGFATARTVTIRARKSPACKMQPGSSNRFDDLQSVGGFGGSLFGLGTIIPLRRSFTATTGD